jgi:toxin ParE1/3/4
LPVEFAFTTQAREDIRDIFEFLLAESPRAADAVLTRFDIAVERLCDHPHIGPLAPETGSSALRRLSIQPYVIYYSADDDLIRIMRILHSARSIDSTVFEAFFK